MWLKFEFVQLFVLLLSLHIIYENVVHLLIMYAILLYGWCKLLHLEFGAGVWYITLLQPFFFKILLSLLQLTFHKNFLSLWQSSRLFFSMRKDLDFSDCIGSVPEFWYISWALSFPYFPYWGYYYLQGPKIFLLASPESFSCAVHSYPDWFWNHTIKISLNQLFSSSLFA